MSQISFEELYAEVPLDQRQQLFQFRQSHPALHFRANGAEWEYIKSGHGKEVILLLVGGLRVADAAYRNIPYLEESFQVLTPSYPALNSMAALADGLANLLDVEEIEKVHVLAGSFGGMLAQVFIRRHPQRVDKLILSTTAVLDTSALERYKQALAALDPMPEDQVGSMAEQMMFQTVAPPPDSHAFYRAYLHELYSYRVDKAQILSTYHCLLDFAENYTLTADDLAGWKGQILILESDDDATFDETIRAAVRSVYPQAQHHVFHNAGHSPAATQPDTYFDVVKTFLLSL